MGLQGVGGEHRLSLELTEAQNPEHGGTPQAMPLPCLFHGEYVCSMVHNAETVPQIKRPSHDDHDALAGLMERWS